VMESAWVTTALLPWVAWKLRNCGETASCAGEVTTRVTGTLSGEFVAPLSAKTRICPRYVPAGSTGVTTSTDTVAVVGAFPPGGLIASQPDVVVYPTVASQLSIPPPRFDTVRF